MEFNFKKSLPYLGGFLGAVLLATAAFVGGVWYKGQLTLQPQAQQESCEDCIKPFPAPDTSDWKTYRNEELGFEVRYPEATDVSAQIEVTDNTEHLNRYLNDYREACETGELEGCGGGPAPESLISFQVFPQQLLRAVADNAFHNNNPFLEPYEFYIGVYDPESFGGPIEDADLIGKSGIKWIRNRTYSGGLIEHTNIRYQGFVKRANGDQTIMIVFSDKYNSEFYTKLTDTIVSTFKLLE